MLTVAVRILHADPSPRARPLERRLAEVRLEVARRVADRFRAAGAHDVEIVRGPGDDTPFGRRLRTLVGSLGSSGLVIAGSGAIPLARPRDLAPFLAVAGRPDRSALANNAYSADVVAVAGAHALLEVPDLPTDNALPRWLAEHAGYEVSDLRRRWRLQVDVDSPLDSVLVGGGGNVADVDTPVQAVEAALAAFAAVARDARAEVVVAGRTSARALRRLEDRISARVRALVEERGLRAAAAAARGDGAAGRPPRSVVGMLLDRDGPEALGPRLAELGDAALVDTRVLLAHRFGADESAWPQPEDRYASDLLLPERVDDPWLRALTASAAAAPIPIVLGGHTLVGPGLRLVMRKRG